MNHVRELIPAYISGELDPDRTAAVKAHLARCSACRAEADRTTDLWDWLGSAEKSPTASPSVWPAVQARTVGPGDGSTSWFFGTGPWMRTGLATMALAAGLVIGVMAPAGSGEPTTLEGSATEVSWLLESSWLSGSSWLSDEGLAGLDDVLLGTDLADEGNGS